MGQSLNRGGLLIEDKIMELLPLGHRWSVNAGILFRTGLTVYVSFPAYRNTNADDSPSTSRSGKKSKALANDIRQWENGRREHVLDAVDMLDSRNK